ncbi:MAG: TonB family protein [Pseudomonadota bacterium]
MKSVLLFAIALLGAGMSTAPVIAQVETEVDVAPQWKRKPSVNDLNAVWPTEAAKKQQTGRALIGCKLNTLGVLYDCRVITEEPAGASFGAAALALTPQLLFTPALKGGRPVAFSEVRIPINFKVPPPPPKPHDFAPQRVASNVRWLAAPTYEEVVAAYPVKAREAKLGGTVSLTCTMTKEGRAKACSTMVEEPKGYGFAAAARALSPRFAGPTVWSDGKSVSGASVDISFSFLPSMLADGPRLVGKPQWARVPTLEQLATGFPKGEDRVASTVRVVLDCLVETTGGLTDCKVQGETPPGQGFGEAAVKMSQYFQVTTWTLDGLPTSGGRIKVPIRYELTPPAAPAAKP